MISIVVGVTLIVPINNVINNVTGNVTEATGLGGLSNILVIVFVMIIILGAVASLAGNPFGKKELKEDKSVYKADVPPEKPAVEPTAATMPRRKSYSRNKDMCPCGSGKKYTECCGK